ncbi:MAG: DUF2062 domain-containing protein [Pseudomonadota bacterium]
MQPIWARLRHAFWPRAGWGRASRYLAKRAMRIAATPHAVAAGLAMGALSSFTPFLGLHFLLAFALAALLGGNMLAAALGTAVGNPLTFPIIWAASFKLGRWVLGEPNGQELVGEPVNLLRDSFFNVGPMLWPMLLGGMLMGVPVALTIYVVSRSAVAAFQRQRRERLGKVVIEAG